MPLTINTDDNASSVEWIVAYSPADISAVTLSPGTAAAAAGKNVQCNTIAPGRTKCIASGMNAKGIPDGLLATAKVTIAPTTGATSTSVQILSVLGASGAGDAVNASATGNTVSIIRPIALSALNCLASTLIVPASTQCTVALSTTATSKGFPVTLGYSVTGAVVTMPSSITVPAGSASGNFMVQVPSIVSATILHVSATAEGITKTVPISLRNPPAPVPPTPVPPPPPPAPADKGPEISAVVVSPSQTSAVVSWKTKKVASSTLEYGLSPSALTNKLSKTSKVTSHSITAIRLKPSTTYYYRVLSLDAQDNISIVPASGASTFKTTSLPPTNDPPPSTDKTGLLAFWNFEETGSEAIDQVGNIDPARIFGATRTAGRTGRGLSFNGVSDYVGVEAFDLPGSALTIASWFKADSWSNGADPRIISKATGSGEQDHYFMLGTISVSGGERLRFRLKTGGQTTTVIASSGNLPIGQWVHAAATYDGSTIRLYVNGTLVGSGGAGGSITGNKNVPIAIGKNPGNGQAYGPFDGVIDQLRVYTRALTPGELVGLYQSGQ